MNGLRMHLWREWREHRLALLVVFLVLPLLGWAVAHVPTRAALGDPLIQSGAALAFVVVLLVAVGGELLGVERRGRGPQWLERMPSGLEVAFLAKLLFLALTVVLAAVYGLGVARSIALLRGVEPQAIQWEPLTFLAGVALVLWTFACSAWTLRGGVALLAAALILAVFGYPVWRVMDAGYRPWPSEVGLLAGTFLASALLGAWLAFVPGARLGRGILGSTLLGLAPAAAALLITASWCSIRLREREVLDPLSGRFWPYVPLVTADGRTALVIGHQELPRWTATPRHALRLDLVDLSCEPLGRVADHQWRYREDGSGLFLLDELVVFLEGRETPMVFDAVSGEQRRWEASKKGLGGWAWKGLGLYVRRGVGGRPVIRDPFRGRDYPVEGLGRAHVAGDLLVRPGRWLYSLSPDRWMWLDPDTNQRVDVDWPALSQPLVIFPDGRILLANAGEGLQLVHPEQGLATALDSQGIAVEHIESNWNCARVPGDTFGKGRNAHGPIVLQTSGDAWLILDEEATSVRRLPVSRELTVEHWLGEDAALVWNWQSLRLGRLDLASGEVTELWPLPPSD